jgi:hypothetical protein
MLISFPFLPQSGGNADSYELAALSEVASLDEYESVHGIYPVSHKRQWHGGIHLSPRFVDEPVRAIADGTVPAYRAASSCVEEHDNSFVLLRHETETGQGRSITFYSLYMHLMNHKDLRNKANLLNEMVPFMQTPGDEARRDNTTRGDDAYACVDTAAFFCVHSGNGRFDFEL